MTKTKSILLAIGIIIVGYAIDMLAFCIPREYNMLGAIMFFAIGPGIILYGFVDLIRKALMKR